MIPVHHFVSLLEGEFFSKWLQVLFSWLANGPDYEEVSRWYLGWKKMIPPEILNHDRIRTQFNIALEAMNKAVTGSIFYCYFFLFSFCTLYLTEKRFYSQQLHTASSSSPYTSTSYFCKIYTSTSPTHSFYRRCIPEAASGGTRCAE